MEIDKYTQRSAIKTVLLAELLLESLDDVKGSTIYNSTIKNLVNKLQNVLLPFCRRYYDSIYNEDVAESIDVLDSVIVDQLVHNVVLEIQPINPYNLYILKDKNGRKIKIKSKLDKEAFENEYGVKLTNLTSKKF